MKSQILFYVAALTAVGAIAQSAGASVASDLLGLTGNKQVKLVWSRQVNGHDKPFGGGSYRLMRFDTASGESDVLGTTGNYFRAKVTTDGNAIVYNKDSNLWMVNWDGSNNHQVIADAGLGCVLNGYAYVTLGGGSMDYANTNADLYKVQLSNPNNKSLVYSGTLASMWLSISTDGAKLGGHFPWSSGGGIVTVSNGSLDVFGDGCWGSVTTDTSYRYARFDGSHRYWRVWNADHSNQRDVQLNGGPGVNGWEIYHPRFTMNNPGFVLVTGPYDQGSMGGNNIGAGSPNCELYFGKFDSGITSVVSWVKVTANTQGDYHADGWIGGSSPPPNQSPSVSISAPANGTTYTAPASMTISADASDTDGSVAKVEFFAGGTKLGEDTSAPYTCAWANVAAGAYSLTAKATDDDGATTTSSAVSVTVNAPANQPPTVSVTAPANGASFTAPASITITADASDTDGSVAKVEFFAGAAKLGEDTTHPFAHAWTGVGAGTYSITAKATDDDGATVTSAAVTATVTDPANSPPTVAITQPADGAPFTAPASVTITADASDTDGSVVKVEFFAGATKLGEDTTHPFAYAWSGVGAGTYVLAATATDDDGGTATSASVTVTVAPGAATLPLRLDCGPDVTSQWSDEGPYATDGSEFTFSGQPDTTGVTNAAPASVYKTCRHLDHSYSIPVPDGTYTVRLHFYDEYPGSRSMDYTIEGAKVLDDYAIPGSTPTVETFVVSVAGGDGLQILAAADGGNDAFECGIEVLAGASANTAPVVHAGDDLSVDLGSAATLDATVTDDGLPGGATTVTWTLVSGPGAADFADASAPETTVTVSAEGIYTLRLTADDGELQGHDDVLLEATAPSGPVNILTSPNGGEVWYVGTTRTIEWSAIDLDSASIYYSTDNGGTALSIDDSVTRGEPGWGSMPWVVPDTPSTQCIVILSGYFGEAPTQSAATFEIRAVADADGDGMDDTWETGNFGDLARDGTGDADDDGATDLVEFLAGTDPNVSDAEESLPAFSCAPGTRTGFAAVAPLMIALALTLAYGARRRHETRAAAPRRTRALE